MPASEVVRATTSHGMTSVPYSVQLSPYAVRGYKHLNPAVKPQIRAALDSLRAHPLAGPKTKRLKGQLHDYYRYRVGDYRIVYTIAHHERTVFVDYIQHRKDVYR